MVVPRRMQQRFSGLALGQRQAFGGQTWEVVGVFEGPVEVSMPRMLAKGKLKFKCHKIKGRREVRRIFEHFRKRGPA